MMIYLVLAVIYIGICFFFNPKMLKKLPKLKVYKDELHFSSDNAYRIINELVEQFPNRIIGSEPAIASASWICEQFSKLELTSWAEEYECYISAELITGHSNTADNGACDVKVKGINIIAVENGETKNVILIGAHRDVKGQVAGAEDNASGTASMLELARVLCSREHYYTYYFVSFDGEEYGKSGAIDFIKHYHDLNIKLVLILDMTGYKNATTIGFYNYAHINGAAPLWTFALANSILEEDKLVPYYLIPYASSDKNTKILFGQVLHNKTIAHANTDSAPFIEKNIPAIALFAAGDSEQNANGWYSARIAHSDRDTIEQISKSSLEMTGRFAEKYIKSFEINSFNKLPSSRNYALYATEYISSLNISGYCIMVFALLGLMLCLNTIRCQINPGDYLIYIESQWKWLIMPFIIAIIIVLTYSVFNKTRLRTLPGKIKACILLFIAGVGILLIVLLKTNFGENILTIVAHPTGIQMGLLNIIYIIITIAMLMVLNPFKVFSLTVFPILLLGGLNNMSFGTIIINFFVFFLCALVQPGINAEALKKEIRGDLSVKNFVQLVLILSMWIYSFTLIFA